MAGLTNEGFEIKTYEQALAELEERERALIEPELDLTPETILGNINAIIARSDALIWEALGAIVNQFDPDNAEGVMLDNICKLSGIARDPATFSFTNVQGLFSSAGVQLLPDVHFFSTDGGIRFTPSSAFVSSGVGYESIPIRSEETGTLNIDAGSISVISTPVAGLEELINSGEINSLNSGSEEETDEELRNRRKFTLTNQGSCTVPSIETALRLINSELGEIYYVKIFEATDAPTTFVEKRNSFKAIIYDSNTGQDWDNLIAQTISDNKPAGIESLGSSDGYASTGLIKFERANVVNLYITATYYYTGSLPNSAEVKTYIKNIIDTTYDVGDDIVSFAAASIPIAGFANIKDVDFNGFGINTSGSPTAGDNDNIIISFNEKPIIETANITLNFTRFTDQN